jgi:E3 ubiquitin-protein ligase RNF115/126
MPSTRSREVREDQGTSSNDNGLLEEYVLGDGLSLLLQHLAESDPNDMVPLL